MEFVEGPGNWSSHDSAKSWILTNIFVITSYMKEKAPEATETGM